MNLSLLQHPFFSAMKKWSNEQDLSRISCNSALFFQMESIASYLQSIYWSTIWVVVAFSLACGLWSVHFPSTKVFHNFWKDISSAMHFEPYFYDLAGIETIINTLIGHCENIRVAPKGPLLFKICLEIICVQVKGSSVCTN